MKKILSLLGTITLIGTSTTSLVACNKPQYNKYELKEEKEKPSSYTVLNNNKCINIFNIQDEKINLNKINEIINSSESKPENNYQCNMVLQNIKDKNNVTSQEILENINPIILKMFNFVKKEITINDYNIVVYNSRNFNDILKTIDMTIYWRTIYFKIFSKNKNLFSGETPYISIKFRNLK